MAITFWASRTVSNWTCIRFKNKVLPATMYRPMTSRRLRRKNQASGGDEDGNEQNRPDPSRALAQT